MQGMRVHARHVPAAIHGLAASGDPASAKKLSRRVQVDIWQQGLRGLPLVGVVVVRHVPLLHYQVNVRLAAYGQPTVARHRRWCPTNW
jgi:hypothetical protein